MTSDKTVAKQVPVVAEFFVFLISALDGGEWLVSFTLQPLYPPGKEPKSPLDRRVGRPQSPCSGINFALVRK
jgi:hypothetical protein